MKSYLQQFEIDFNEIFIVVVKLMAFQVLFIIVIYYDMNIYQIDVKIAFLYSLINQLIYIEIPKCIETNMI